MVKEMITDMAKDYTIGKTDRNAIERANAQIGDLGIAVRMCAEKSPRIQRLMRHAIHGRCGYNADDALADFDAWLSRIDPKYDIRNPRHLEGGGKAMADALAPFGFGAN